VLAMEASDEILVFGKALYLTLDALMSNLFDTWYMTSLRTHLLIDYKQTISKVTKYLF
jgi:hypothetical protein